MPQLFKIHAPYYIFQGDVNLGGKAADLLVSPGRRSLPSGCHGPASSTTRQPMKCFGALDLCGLSCCRSLFSRSPLSPVRPKPKLPPRRGSFPPSSAPAVPVRRAGRGGRGAILPPAARAALPAARWRRCAAAGPAAAGRAGCRAPRRRTPCRKRGRPLGLASRAGATRAQKAPGVAGERGGGREGRQRAARPTWRPRGGGHPFLCL